MGWNHIEDTTPKARKRHQCYVCCGWIEIGEQYVRRFGFMDDEPCTTIMHMDCEKITQSWDEMDWESFSPGDLSRSDLEHLKVEGK